MASLLRKVRQTTLSPGAPWLGARSRTASGAELVLTSAYPAGHLPDCTAAAAITRTGLNVGACQSLAAPVADAGIALSAAAGGLLGLLRQPECHPEHVGQAIVDRLAEGMLRMLGIPAAEAARLAVLPQPEIGARR